jgi:Flp pilus assembly protein TadG
LPDRRVAAPSLRRVPIFVRQSRFGIRRSPRSRGQSAVEFALVLPVLLTITLIALDFGRVFMGWVDLNNSVRVAADYAAKNPSAWSASRPNLAAQSTYQQLVTNDADKINCTLPSIPAPVFPSGISIGAPATVSITCQFSLITPVIGNLIGNPLPVTATAAFPIGAGTIEGIPVDVTTPTPSPTPTATPTPSPSSSGSGGPSPSASASPTPSPTPMCTVPNLIGVSTKVAQDLWGTKGHGSTNGAQFGTNLIFNPLVGGPGSDYTIHGQSIPPGTVVPCGTTYLTVNS